MDESKKSYIELCLALAALFFEFVAKSGIITLILIILTIIFSIVHLKYNSSISVISLIIGIVLLAWTIFATLTAVKLVNNQLGTAKKNAFMIETNQVLTDVKQYIAIEQLNGGEIPKCISIEEAIKDGRLSSFEGGNYDNYKGIIMIADGGKTLTISLTNGTYGIEKHEGKINHEDLGDIKEGSSFVTTQCP